MVMGVFDFFRRKFGKHDNMSITQTKEIEVFEHQLEEYVPVEQKEIQDDINYEKKVKVVLCESDSDQLDNIFQESSAVGVKDVIDKPYLIEEESIAGEKVVDEIEGLGGKEVMVQEHVIQSEWTEEKEPIQEVVPGKKKRGKPRKKKEKEGKEMLEAVESSDVSELNEEQKAAVGFDGKHLLVLAGAGTGKTKTIVSRALHLVDKGIAPSRIMILSFTRKSAYEIVNRIKALNAKSIGVTGQTFHSWCMGIIKSHPNIFDCANSTCLDDDDRESAIKLLCGKKFRDKDDMRIPPAAVMDVYSYSCNAKCSLSESIRIKVYDNGDRDTLRKKIEKNKPLYEDVIRKYIEYKKEHDYIDYDDILRIVSVGLKKNPEAAKFISSQYDHILVDEMQDTNPLQYELLSSFYDNCHLFCVGDDAQSIYGFRGADFKTIHNFTNIVEGASSLKLSLNYRSTQEILDLANWVLSKSPLKYDKYLRAFRGHGDKPKMIHVNSEWEEANHITDDILTSLNERGYKYKDHLVLSRSNWGLKKLETCCLAKKIPYQIFGGTSLMQSKHIRDIMSALRIAANFRDELAWVIYLHLWKGIGDAITARIIQQLFGCVSLKECVIKLKDMNLQQEIYEVLENLDGLQSNPSKAVSIAVKIMSPRLSVLYKDNGWRGRKQDFLLLRDLAMNCGSISEFIAEYVLDPKLGMYDKKEGKIEDVVTLSTIHSAKGLEAANCYVINVDPYSYPTPRAVLNGLDAVEEERRCLYVALTRAKDRLYLYRNSSATSVADKNSLPKVYEEEIKADMKFIQKKYGTPVIITAVRDSYNEKIISFYIDKNQNKKEQEMSEWAFRNAYITENEYNLANASLQYFFNDVPQGLIDNVFINGDKIVDDKQYKGRKIDTNMDDFDFS